MHVGRAFIHVYDVNNPDGMMIKAEVQLGDQTPAKMLSFIIEFFRKQSNYYYSLRVCSLVEPRKLHWMNLIIPNKAKALNQSRASTGNSSANCQEQPKRKRIQPHELEL